MERSQHVARLEAFEEKRHNVWLQAWSAVANANDCKSSSTATAWADRALNDFDQRFKPR